jgi:phenylacetic acid degradation operon negative regulatory protein
LYRFPGIIDFMPMHMSKNPTDTLSLPAWLDGCMSRQPPRAKSLVMTLFGDVVAPHGGGVWLGSLIALLAPFGINDRLVRTSVFRLAEEGWLDAQREGRRSRYALDARSARRFYRAHQRVYTPLQHDWNGRWTMVFANVGHVSAEQRAALRKELLWQGYATIAPYVFAHPAPDRETLADVLQRCDASDLVFVCSATEPEGAGGRPLADLVGECWELGQVRDDYNGFIDDFASLGAILDRADAAPSPEQAFVARQLTIHAYRRIKLHDPQLPLALLPADWPGTAAFDLCRRIYRATWQGAEQHILATLRTEDDAAAGVAASFFDRFGGLD